MAAEQTHAGVSEEMVECDLEEEGREQEAEEEAEEEGETMMARVRRT